MRRTSVNKSKSARSFNRGAKKTHLRNVQIMRGGFRL